ncbi:uncharacterized protein LOC121824736 [Peromyscus maniculatus bairdii]|uniref:uncharacterized protein LOC121824736 n=1 Tax=Peromyscus maniculatus bairdii TaxID=230844 RepID=UPI003FD2FEDB
MRAGPGPPASAEGPAGAGGPGPRPRVPRAGLARREVGSGTPQAPGAPARGLPGPCHLSVPLVQGCGVAGRSGHSPSYEAGERGYVSSQPTPLSTTSPAPCLLGLLVHSCSSPR